MTEISERATLLKVTRRLIPFLFVLYVVAYLDRVNVGFAKLQMNKDLGFDDAIYGFGAGIFFIGYFLFEVPSNVILERVGARPWIARIMFTWGALAVAMMFTWSKYSFYGLRFLLGIAEAGFFPGIILYLTYWFSAAERARIVALFMTATLTANIIGSPVSGALLGVTGWGLKGWQWLYLLEGLPAILLGFVVMLYLPNGPKDARWLTEAEREWLLARKQNEPQAAHSTLSGALLHPMVWMLGLLYFLLVVGMYGIALWLPQIVKNFSNQSNLIVGLLTALPYIAAMIGMLLVANHSDKTGERRLHIALPAFLGAFGLLLSAFLHTPAAVLAALALAALGMWGTLGPFWTLPPAFLRGTAAAGGIALINSIGNLGGFVGPYIVGQVTKTTNSFQGGLLVLCFSMFCGGLVALCLQRKSRVEGAPIPETV